MNLLVKYYVETVMETLGAELSKIIRMESNINADNETIFSLLKEEIELASELNFLEHYDYRLIEGQLEMCVTAVSTRLILNNLINEGLVQVDFDVELGKNMYSLTEKGKQTNKTLFDLF